MPLPLVGTVKNRDGTGEKRLTNNPASDHVPIWHPNNQIVVFSSGRDGNLELYSVDINNPEPQGGQSIRLTNALSSDDLLGAFNLPGAFSADGNFLYWHSSRPGNNWDIFKMDYNLPEAQGGSVTNLTNTSDKDEFVLNFGFDHHELVFVVKGSKGSSSVSIMSALDGSNRRVLRADADLAHFVIPPERFMVTGICPSQALNSGILDAIVSGSGFQTGASVRLERNGQVINGTDVVVESQTTIKAKFDVDNKPEGAWDVVVRNPDGQEARLYGCLNLLDATPQVAAVNPNEVIAAAAQNKDMTLTVTGDRFLNGAQVRLEKNGQQILAKSVTFKSQSELDAVFDFTNQPIGTYDVVVKNPNNKEGRLAQGFYLRSSQPSISLITPSSHENFGTVEVQISGNKFLPNAQVKLVLEGETDIPASQVQFVNQTELKATFDLTAKKPGNWKLVIQNPDGSEANFLFFLNFVIPQITDVTPDPIRATGEYVSLEIQGEKFLPGSQVVLYHFGQKVIPTVEEQTDRRILARFSTAHVELGTWMVQVTHPFALEVSFYRAISIDAPNIYANVEGPGFLGHRRLFRYSISVENRSISFPTGAVMVFISGISPGIDYEFYNPDGQLVAKGTTEENLVIRHIDKEIPPNGIQVWQLGLMVDLDRTPQYEYPNGANPPVIHVLTGQWLRKVLHAGGEEFVKVYNEIAKQLGESLLTEEDKQKVLQVLDEFLEAARTGSRTVSRLVSRDLDAIPEEALGSAEKTLRDVFKARAEFFHASKKVISHYYMIPAHPVTKGMVIAFKISFGDEVHKNYQAAREQDQAIAGALWEGRPIIPGYRQLWSSDPNFKIGLFGVNGFITSGETLRYEVHFGNDPKKATAPAEEVRVTDVLDENLNLDTFAFEEVNFSGKRFQVSGQTFTLSIPHSYTFQLDGQTFNLSMTVTIEGSLDRANRTVQVRFHGVGPNVGLGFLPPNKTPPEGEGSFRFSVKPKDDAPSGVQIKNKATIVFDVNPPMDTNEHVLTLDKNPPDVHIAALPTEQPSPSFPIRWEGSDDASGIGELQIWVSDNDGPFQLLDILGVGGRAIPTEIPFKGKFGHEYRFYAVATDKVGNKQPHPDKPQATTRAGKPLKITAGLKMITLPVISEIADPKQVFAFEENKWAWYDPATGQYVLYPNAPAATLQVGKGFWARFSQDVTPNAKGDLPDDTKPFAIALKHDWNLIGNPWLTDLLWDVNAIQVQVNGQTKPLKDAEGIVEPYAWRWDGSNYRLVFDANLLPGVDNKLLAWEGVWVYAHKDSNLILPVPSRMETLAGRSRREKPKGWMARLSAQVGDEKTEGLMGIAAGRGLKAGEPPAPPEGKQGVQVLFLDKDGNPYKVDVRNKIGQRQEWDVLVRFGTKDEGRGTRQNEVTLSWDGVGYAPKDVSLTLVDLATGTRRYMRTQTAYRFIPSEGETERRFKVIAELGNTRPFRIVGLKATPMRGQGVIIEFALTKPAQVQAEVLTLTGRRVAVLDKQGSRGAGLQRLVWRGINDDGTKVNMGVYLIRVHAIDEEGRQVQAVTTVRNGR